MDKKKVELVVVNAVSKTLNKLRMDPYLSDEGVLSDVISELDVSYKLKRIAVPAIVKTLKYCKEGINEKEIMQKVLDELDYIIKKVEMEKTKVKKEEKEKVEV